MARIPNFLGLFASGPGPKIRTTVITDEAGSQVNIQAGSVSDPDSTTIANVKAANTLASSNDNALVVTLREVALPPGSAGTDLSPSAGKPAIPLVGSNFANTGPYAGYVLIATIPANMSRLNIDIANNSGGQIVLIVDDGAAATNAAPTNATLYSLSGGLSVGSQGGGWSSSHERGRIQVFAPSANAQVAVRQN